jgi:hypothetical protein
VPEHIPVDIRGVLAGSSFLWVFGCSGLSPENLGAGSAYMSGITRRSEADIARALVLEHGRKKALQLTVSRRMNAKRARSRREYQFWAAVGSEIESLFPISRAANEADDPLNRYPASN